MKAPPGARTIAALSIELGRDTRPEIREWILNYWGVSVYVNGGLRFFVPLEHQLRAGESIVPAALATMPLIIPIGQPVKEGDEIRAVLERLPSSPDPPGNPDGFHLTAGITIDGEIEIESDMLTR